MSDNLRRYRGIRQALNPSLTPASTFEPVRENRSL